MSFPTSLDATPSNTPVNSTSPTTNMTSEKAAPVPTNLEALGSTIKLRMAVKSSPSNTNVSSPSGTAFLVDQNSLGASEEPTMDTTTTANIPATPDATSNDLLVLPASRTPYDNGYGDFCFGRVGDEDHLRSAKGLFENSRFEELDDYERTGVFPFMRLPIEIRKRILRLIINPYLTFPEDGGPSYVQAHISDAFDESWLNSGHQNYDTNDVGATFVWEIDTRDPDPGVRLTTFETPTIPPLSSQQVQLNEGRAIRLREKQAWLTAPHPQRANRTGGHHKVTVTPSSLENGIDTEDPAMYTSLRVLSYVNSQFRLELGQTVWQKFHVSAGGQHSSIGPLSAFLGQRPAIHSSLKSLKLQVTPEDIGGDDFTELCLYFSTTVVLDSFHLEIVADANDLEDLTKGEGRLQSLLAAREINIQKDFRLSVVIPFEEWEFWDTAEGHEEVGKQLLKLKDSYQLSIQALIMPDMLRQPSTEVDGYLATRL